MKPFLPLEGVDGASLYIVYVRLPVFCWDGNWALSFLALAPDPCRCCDDVLRDRDAGPLGTLQSLARDMAAGAVSGA